jgi:hypothetical protein
MFGETKDNRAPDASSGTSDDCDFAFKGFHR